MPKSTPVIFKKSLLAAAVISLSACSSMPQAPDLSGVGDGIVKAGKATASAGKKTWNTTTYLLGFTDAPGDEADAPSDEQLLLAQTQDPDDINQVLPLIDAPADTTVAEDTAEAQPTVIQQATAVMSPDENAANDTPVLADSATAVAEDAPRSDTMASVSNDVIHEVAENETLWDIAKLTTGDATNWHVLADINNLKQNATVFPGQQLIIPGAIAKEEYASTLATPALDSLIDTKSADSATDDQPVIGAARDVRKNIRSTEQADVAISVTDTQVNDEQVADAAAQLASAEQDATPFDLNDGETLWDFAKRTTGDATNWQAIANQNNFTEKQSVTVRAGQTIFVPLSLLKDNNQASVPEQATDEQATEEAVIAAVTETPEDVAEAASDELAAALPTAEPMQDAQQLAQDGSTEVDPDTSLTETSTALVEGSTLDDNNSAGSTEGSLLDETKPLTIVEATYKTDDTLNPVKADDETLQIVENTDIPSEIMVSGTYYPKAVYNDADFSSSLLMRVSPGTTLQVSRAMGTWFQVETDKGVGYVHQRDIQ